MTYRITLNDLENRIEEINTLTSQPAAPWQRNNATGGLKANIGNYHLYQANSCYNLHQMHTEGGGVNDILFGNTKADLWQQMGAYINGIHAKRERG